MSLDLKSIAREVIEKLKVGGADMAQCTLALTEKREFNMDGGAFSLFRTTFGQSLQLTAYKGGRRGTLAQSSLSPEAIDKAIGECLALADAASPDDAWEIAPSFGERSFGAGTREPDVDGLFARTRELADDIKARYPKVMIEQMIVDHTGCDSVYADTSGNLYRDESGSYNVSLMFSGHEGEKASSFFSSGFSTASLDAPFISLGSVEMLLAAAEKQITTEAVDGKFVGTVIFTPECVGELLSSIVDNFASGNALIEGTSIWKDKLGEVVADESVTVAIAPHTDEILHRQEYTGDGYPTENFYLIEKGVLRSFVASVYAANKAGIERSKNTSSAFVVAGGEKSLDELIASVDRGLLVSRISGGRPASSGDFSAVAKNSFLIEDGKIGAAVSETMISGNLAEMLMHPAGASAERVADGYTLLPYLAFSGITVSGK